MQISLPPSDPPFPFPGARWHHERGRVTRAGRQKQAARRADLRSRCPAAGSHMVGESLNIKHFHTRVQGCNRTFLSVTSQTIVIVQLCVSSIKLQGATCSLFLLPSLSPPLPRAVTPGPWRSGFISGRMRARLARRRRQPGWRVIWQRDGYGETCSPRRHTRRAARVSEHAGVASLTGKCIWIA